MLRACILIGLSLAPAIAFGLTPMGADPLAQPPDKPPSLKDPFGDLLPPHARARFGTVRLRHGDAIKAIAYFPDGKTLISGGADGAVSIWDAATGRLVRALQPPSVYWVAALAVSPGGQWVAVATGQPRIVVYNTATGKPHRNFQSEVYVTQLGFSPDGKRLAVVGAAQTLTLWDLTPAIPVPTFQANELVCAAGFSADGKTLLGVTPDHVFHRWPIAVGGANLRLPGSVGAVVSAAFSPDGRLLACSLKDHTLCLTDVATGKQLWQRIGKRAIYLTWAFTADGKTLAVGNGYEPTRLWDVPAGKELGVLPAQGCWLHALAFSPDGKTLAGSNQNAVRQWSVATLQETLPLDAAATAVTAVALAADGGTALTVDESGRVTLWDVASGRKRLSLRHSAILRIVALSPRADRVATGGWGQVVRLWDTATGKEVQQLAGHLRDVTCLAFAPDGKTLASGAKDKTVRLWDVAAGKLLRTLSGGSYRSRGLCFAPDGKTLATVSIEDGLRSAALHLWDVTTGQPRLLDRALDAYGADFVTFSSDGRLLAVGGGAWSAGPWRVKVFEVATGSALWERQSAVGTAETHSIVTGLAFAPDCTTLIVAHTGEVRFLDVGTGKERRRLTGHAGQVLALALSADGRTMATGSGDTTALVWDATAFLKTERPAATKLSVAELHACWARLADGPAGPAYAAVEALAAAPEQALPWLTQHLVPVPALDEVAATKWFKQLDDKRFGVREKAFAALEKYKDVLMPLLRQWQVQALSPETRKRLEQLAAKGDPVAPGPEPLRALRAVWVLERMGTAGARQVLQTLAAGAPAARQTQAAQTALRRLGELRP